MPEPSTTVTEAVVDLNDILGMPGGDNIMLPENEKPNMFSREKVDLSFIDKSKKESDSIEESEEAKAAKKVVAEDLEDKSDKDDTDLNLDLDKEDDEEEKKSVGRPSSILSATKKLIQEGILIPFDEDEKALDSYKEEDYLELIRANFNEREKKIQEEFSGQFYDSLPPELQVAAKYAADGGNDFKNLFRALAATEEVRDLDASNEEDQSIIVRKYLTATNFGTAEDIEEEIAGWKDRDELGNKANKFKPKLDKMQEGIIARQIADQENKRAQQQVAAKKYMDSIYSVLEPGTLNNIKMDKKVQGMLYSGLVQPNYPSISGRPTNLLGHLLEKHQYVEPNHALVAECLWLLADPAGYRKKLIETGGSANAEKTARLLKTEEQRGKNSAHEDDATTTNKNKKTLRRQDSGKGFFAR